MLLAIRGPSRHRDAVPRCERDLLYRSASVHEDTPAGFREPALKIGPLVARLELLTDSVDRLGGQVVFGVGVLDPPIHPNPHKPKPPSSQLRLYLTSWNTKSRGTAVRSRSLDGRRGHRPYSH